MTPFTEATRAAVFIILGLAVFAQCKSRPEEEGRTAKEAKSPANATSNGVANPPTAATLDGYHVLSDRTGKYGRVLVGERNGQRCLAINSFSSGMQGCIDPQAPGRSVHEFVELLPIGTAFVSRPQRFLMIGLGCGAVVHRLLPALPGLHLDAVELDPLIIDAAAEHFDIATGKQLAVHEGDGRAFLEQSTETWDLILLDAFSDNYIPFSLATVEFMELVKSKLRPGGAVAANLWNTHTRRFRAQLLTMARVFPSVYTFDGPETQTVIAVATRDETKLSKQDILAAAIALEERTQRSLNLEKVAKTYVPLEKYSLDSVPVFRDDQPEIYEKLLK